MLPANRQPKTHFYLYLTSGDDVMIHQVMILIISFGPCLYNRIKLIKLNITNVYTEAKVCFSFLRWADDSMAQTLVCSEGRDVYVV